MSDLAQQTASSTTQMPGMSPEALARLLHYAFVEIRAADDLSRAVAIADVFHNTPWPLVTGHDPDEVLAEIRKRAKRQKLEEFIDGLISSAIQNTN